VLGGFFRGKKESEEEEKKKLVVYEEQENTISECLHSTINQFVSENTGREILCNLREDLNGTESSYALPEIFVHTYK
jgi:hypothetical protein